MIKIILYLICIVIYGYVMYLLNTRDFNSGDLLYGTICYNCKSDIHNNNKKPTLCEKCKREYKLSKFLYNFNLMDFKFFLLTKIRLISITIIIVLLSTMLLNLILKLGFGITFIDYIYPIILIIGALLNLCIIKVNTIKKGPK